MTRPRWVTSPILITEFYYKSCSYVSAALLITNNAVLCSIMYGFLLYTYIYTYMKSLLSLLLNWDPYAVNIFWFALFEIYVVILFYFLPINDRIDVAVSKILGFFSKWKRVLYNVTIQNDTKQILMNVLLILCKTY